GQEGWVGPPAALSRWVDSQIDSQRPRFKRLEQRDRRAHGSANEAKMRRKAARRRPLLRFLRSSASGQEPWASTRAMASAASRCSSGTTPAYTSAVIAYPACPRVLEITSSACPSRA